MRRAKNRLPIIYSDDALADINEIADWNERHFSKAHAKAYIQYLQHQINGLSSEPQKGRTVISRPDLRFIRIQRRSKAHGHLAVYVFDAFAVTIIHVFHTAQDWESRLNENH